MAPVQPRVHPAVQRVLDYVRRHEMDAAHTSVARLAQLADLSPSRFMHVFTESMGVPVRPYLRGLRLQRAIEAVRDGHSITDAAYLAGFADGPHFARTARRLLGVTPRALVPRGACARQSANRCASSQCGNEIGNRAGPEAVQHDQSKSVARGKEVRLGGVSVIVQS